MALPRPWIANLFVHSFQFMRRARTCILVSATHTLQSRRTKAGDRSCSWSICYLRPDSVCRSYVCGAFGYTALIQRTILALTTIFYNSSPKTFWNRAISILEKAIRCCCGGLYESAVRRLYPPCVSVSLGRSQSQNVQIVGWIPKNHNRMSVTMR